MRITWKVIIAFLLTVICIPQTSICAIGMSASPSTITYDTNTWVDIEITGVTPGADVLLGLHVDLDHDGNLDPEDSLLTAFSITDGQVNSIGSRVIVDDAGGVVNGEIQTRISFHGDSIVRIIGAYLWSVTESGAVEPASTHTFEITQPASSTWVTGTILDSVSSNAVLGALAIMGFPSVYGNEIRAFADKNGMFRIYAPITVPLDNIDMIFAARVGYLSAEPSFYAFTNSLTAGENSLPAPLNIIPQTAPGFGKIYGHVYDDHTNSVTGAFMNYNGYGFSICITDTKGYFEIPVYMDSDAEFSCTGVNMMGLMEFDSEFYISGSTNLDIYLPTANVLAKARIADDHTGESLVGVAAEFNALDGEYYDATGYSLDDGYYEIGLLGDTTYGEVEIDAEDELYPLGYASATRYSDVYVPPPGGVFMLAPFWASKGYILSGHVYDQNTNGLSDGFLLAHEYPGTASSTFYYAKPNSRGYYVMRIPAGTNNIEPHAFSGFVDDSLIVVVTTNGLTGVDFYLAEITPMYYSGNGHWYLQIHGDLNWHDAQDQCTDMGGHLATITTFDEDQFIYYNIVDPDGIWGWLGGTDEGDEGNWHWITEELWGYQNWNQYEPNNMNGNEHYLQYFDSNTFGWNDVPNGDGSFICEWENESDIDLDMDGVIDVWEYDYFGTRGNCEPFNDNDHDGANNLTEYISGMDPTNFASCFRITNCNPLANDFLIEWSSVSGRVYSAFWSDNLTNNFQSLEAGIHYPRNSSTDAVHGAEDKCFYRVDVQME